MFWRVGGERGRELHGWVITAEGFVPDINPPDVIVKAGSGVWDFSVKDVDGQGRCRVGNGCAYNPLHLIEAIYRFVSGSMDAPSLDGIQFSDDFKAWHERMGDDWL